MANSLYANDTPLRLNLVHVERGRDQVDVGAGQVFFDDEGTVELFVLPPEGHLDGEEHETSPFQHRLRSYRGLAYVAGNIRDPNSFGELMVQAGAASAVDALVALSAMRASEAARPGSSSEAWTAYESSKARGGIQRWVTDQVRSMRTKKPNGYLNLVGNRPAWKDLMSVGADTSGTLVT